MGKAAKEQLNQGLSQYLNAIHETLEVLDQTLPTSLAKVGWNDVVQMADQVSKQATNCVAIGTSICFSQSAGMLWTGGKTEVKELEENMATYFNTLQGFLLLSHGSKVGAGPTLSSSIDASVKQVVDCSFMLYKESISVYGFDNKDRKLKIPQLVGTVWDACTAIKKTPATNITAVGRAMTQVAVSIKDVLREMNELRPATAYPTDDNPLEAESGSHDSEDSFDADLGNDLSSEEMDIARLAIEVVSLLLVIVKELIRSITGLLKQEKEDMGSELVDRLERLLRLCQGVGAQVDELGACLYPPQEFLAMNVVVGKIMSIINEMKFELDDPKIDTHTFLEACSNLSGSLRQLGSELDHSSVNELVPEIRNLNVIYP